MIRWKTWSEIKEYIDNNLDLLGDDGWGEVRYNIKKLSSQEKGYMYMDQAKLYENPDYMHIKKHKQLDQSLSYENKDYILKLKKKQLKAMGID